MSCKGAESPSVFVQSVEAVPEEVCVLTTKQQLVDIERFCTDEPSSVLSIDPMFNLGPFYITPSTYNLWSPHHAKTTFLGPVLIHKTRSSSHSTTTSTDQLESFWS